MNKMFRLLTALTFSKIVLLASAPAPAAQEPTSIVKDSLLVKAVTRTDYRGDDNTWSWTPEVSFRINGPIDRSSRIYVEYNIPGSPAVQFDCRSGMVKKGYWEKVDCSSYAIRDKGTTYTGPVTFAIKMQNELLSTGEMTLFNGRIKVGKVREGQNSLPGHLVYYVDHDWTLPIAYVFYTPSSAAGWDSPEFNVAFWVRGEGGEFDPHLLYKGQEGGVFYTGGQRMWASGCGSEETGTGLEASDSTKVVWAQVTCSFAAVHGWDRKHDSEGYVLASNPGEYEVKLLYNKRLSRAIKFTVGANGSMSNGIAEANRMNSQRVIVPIQVLVDNGGQWNREAWRTDAFYGNPLKGFTPAP